VFGAVGWSAIAVCGAVALGSAAAFDVRIAVALAVAAVLGIAMALRPAVTVGLLVVTVFGETLQLGGVTISRLVAPIALLVVFMALTRAETSLFPGRPLFWAAAYASWALASGLWTESTDGTVFSLASLAIALIYMLAVATLLNSALELRRVLYVLAFGAFVSGLVAIVGYLAGTEARTAAGKGDPNFFAALQIVALPPLLVCAAEARSRWLRAFLYATVAVIVVSVFTSLSRGGLLALGVVLLLALLFPARSFFRSHGQKAVLVLVLAAGVAVALQSTGGALTARLGEVEEKGGSGRFNHWRGAWTLIEDDPMLGVGFGSYVGLSNDLLLRTPGTDLLHYKLRPNGSEVHNTYLSTTAELGIPGLVLLLGLMISTARTFRRVAQDAADVSPFVARLANALLLSLIGWAVVAVFLSTETARPFWILVGLSLALPKIVRDEARRRALATGALPASTPLNQPKQDYASGS
jgi:O-antigen ligase